ncbi:uncharacterized protein LOC112173099 isoform X2 [Rosa chinensis]|nr:uncharacterized protein LOC112173099 isoform X2 [Rosa chinensis]
MELSTAWNSRASAISFAPRITPNTCSSSHFQHPSLPPQRLSFPFCPYPFRFVPSKSLTLQARKRNSEPEQQPLVSPTIIEEVSEDDEDDDDVILDDEASVDDDYYGDESAADEAELYDGDGGGGGGISLAGTWWDEKALGIAEEVILTFEGDLKIYAFKTLPNFNIQVRIEKLSNKSGSPSMEDIEAFSRTYRTRLDEAELARSVPENLCLEV